MEPLPIIFACNREPGECGYHKTGLSLKDFQRRCMGCRDLSIKIVGIEDILFEKSEPIPEPKSEDEPKPKNTPCGATTKAGTPCKKLTAPGTKCKSHTK